MTDLKKPEKKSITAYDYHECRDYLQRIHGYDERDYLGTFKGNDDAPYQDFWHFVLDQNGSIHNDCFFTMHEEWADGAEPWQKQILTYYLDAFGEGKKGERSIYFHVWW